jgi:hypothetical protein
VFVCSSTNIKPPLFHALRLKAKPEIVLALLDRHKATSAYYDYVDGTNFLCMALDPDFFRTAYFRTRFGSNGENVTHYPLHVIEALAKAFPAAMVLPLAYAEKDLYPAGVFSACASLMHVWVMCIDMYVVCVYLCIYAHNHDLLFSSLSTHVCMPS